MNRSAWLSRALPASAVALMLLGAMQADASGAVVPSAAPAGIASAGETTLFIQNRGSAAAPAVLELVPQAFAPVRQFGLPLIGLRQVGVVALAEMPGLPSGSYAATIYSDAAVGVVDRITWPAAAGQVASNAAATGADIAVPLVRKGPPECTLLTVHNTDTAADAGFLLQVFAPEGGEPVVESAREVEAGRSVTASVCHDRLFDALPDGFVGSARIRGGGLLAVGAITDANDRGASVYSHGGSTSVAAADRLVAPFVAARWAGPRLPAGGVVTTSTSIAIVNMGDRVADVNVTYRGMAPPCDGRIAVHGDAPVRVQPRGMAIVDQAPAPDGSTGASGLPSGCVATANLTAPGARIAGAVVAVHDTGGPREPPALAAAYDLVPVHPEPVSVFLPLAANRRSAVASGYHARVERAARAEAGALVPRLERRADGETWVFVTNLSDTEVSATLVPFGADGAEHGGCGPYCAAKLDPLSGHAWTSAGVAGLPPGPGRAEVTADGPIAVTILEVPAAADLAAYNALRPSGRGVDFQARFGSAEHVPVALRP